MHARDIHKSDKPFKCIFRQLYLSWGGNSVDPSSQFTLKVKEADKRVHIRQRQSVNGRVGGQGVVLLEEVMDVISTRLP